MPAQKPFDIDQPPLIRGLLIRLTDTSHWLVLIAHHLLADGWSVPTMVRETLALYTGETLSTPAYFGDYLTWLATRDTTATLHWWTENLTGLRAPTLLAATPTEPTTNGVGAPRSADSTTAQRQRPVGLRVPLPPTWRRPWPRTPGGTG